jgi:hypothetical protein
MPEWMDTVVQTLEKRSNLGVLTFPGGSKYIGDRARKPFYHSKQWLHEIYPPLSKTEIDELTRELMLEVLPADLRDFYAVMDGCNLFDAMLKIFGLSSDPNRESGEYAFTYAHAGGRTQPYDRQGWQLYFGSYATSWESKGWLYLDVRDLTVHLCEQYCSEPLRSWESFSVFLSSEVQRLDSAFGPEGERLFKLEGQP